MFYIKENMAASLAHKRPENQDRYFCMDLTGGPDPRSRISVMAVVDGVSSCNGCHASAMA